MWIFILIFLSIWIEQIITFLFSCFVADFNWLHQKFVKLYFLSYIVSKEIKYHFHWSATIYTAGQNSIVRRGFSWKYITIKDFTVQFKLLVDYASYLLLSTYTGNDSHARFSYARKISLRCSFRCQGRYLPATYSAF